MAEEQGGIPDELDTFDAASLIDGLGAEPEPKKAPPKDPATGKFVKAKPEVEEAAEGEDEEKPEGEETEEAETKEEKEVRKLKVKLDGMEQELPEEEVKAGFMLRADYTKKTQALAEERKTVAAERAEMREAMEYYLTRTQAIDEAIESLTGSQEPDWDALSKNSTPEEFTQKWTAWKKGAEQRAQVKAEQARVRELHEQETSRARATRLAEEHSKLEAAIPDLKDPDKGKVLREDLSAYAKSVYRFTDDDLAGIEDHRALVILNKARLYDESQKRIPAVKDKVETAIAALKPSGSAPKPKAKQVEVLRGKFKSSGSQEDAAILLDNLIGGKAS